MLLVILTANRYLSKNLFLGLLMSGLIMSYSLTSAEVGTEPISEDDYAIEVVVTPDKQELVISSPDRSHIVVNNSRYDNGGIEMYFSLLANYISPERFGDGLDISTEFANYQDGHMDSANKVIKVIDDIIVSSAYGDLSKTDDLKEISIRQVLLEASVTKKQIAASCVSDSFKADIFLSTDENGHCDVQLSKHQKDGEPQNKSLLDAPVKFEEVVCLEVFDRTLRNYQTELGDQGTCVITSNNI